LPYGSSCSYSVIKGASNGKFTLPVRKHNDYTFIGWKNKDGKTFTNGSILTSDTTLVAVWKQLQFDITLKDSFQTDSTIIGASNGKFTLPVRSHNDYTFIGWKNKDGKTFTAKDILTSDTYGSTVQLTLINAGKAASEGGSSQPNTITPYWDGCSSYQVRL
jgi:FlaG/FlaF family flagellin (archaellin)